MQEMQAIFWQRNSNAKGVSIVGTIQDIEELRWLKSLLYKNINVSLHAVNFGNKKQVQDMKRLINWRGEIKAVLSIPSYKSKQYTSVIMNNKARVRVRNIVSCYKTCNTYYCDRSETCLNANMHLQRTKKLIIRQLYQLEWIND